jgi:signal transduction histidine kinase
VRFDNTAQADPTQELVTIYARWPEMTLYEPNDSVRYQTVEEHENLLDLLKTMGYYQDKGRDTFYSGASQFDLWNMIVFSSCGIYDLRDYDSASGEPFPDAEYTIMTAMQASPLKIAMTFLRNVYLITFAIALIGFLYVRSRVRKYLIAPLQSINEGVAANWAHISALSEKAPEWKEPYELWEHYRQTQDTLQNNKNEITRLNTALEYAKTAEESRRQMTSNIAHELKTPLAVIHSYAEGLKEHIAEEKRDKYIDIILTEAERTDDMVLEMLDLSRLEAGKVKLSRDDFSLISLTKAIFEKLEMAAQAKELQIKFSFPDDFTITADEARIAQVVENFATNAIKYTPVGGHILVKIQIGRSGTTFSIENDSEPLSSEALSKVWDTFYRTDEARSGGGTGLGLAIAKNIVELHGGKCSVRNTKTGVEFQFSI